MNATPIKYFVRTTEGIQGRFTPDQILSLYAEGKITEESLCFEVASDSEIPPRDMQRWTPVRCAVPAILDAPKPRTPARQESVVSESPLDAVMIIFSRDFSPQEPLVLEILDGMVAHDHPYRYWLRDQTPIRTFVNPAVTTDFHVVLATAYIQFRMLMGEDFRIEKVEKADFEASQGISGVILSHWNGANITKQSKEFNNPPVQPAHDPRQSKQVFLARPGGETEGPYTLPEIGTLLATGCKDTDFWAWYEGLREWIPLYSVPGIEQATTKRRGGADPGVSTCEKCDKHVPASEIVVVGKWRVCKSCDKAADARLDQLLKGRGWPH